MEQSTAFRVAVSRVVLSLVLAVAVGCGGKATLEAAPAASGGAAAADPGGAASASGDTAAATQSVTEAAAAAPIKPTVPAPTADQIAHWTPAPFEPVQLLGICEWKKTSFTSRIAPAPDGKHFIVAGSRVLLWSIAADEPEHVFLELTADDGDRQILSLAVSPDGRWFAVGDSNGIVRMWNLESREEILSKELGTNGVTCLAISPDGKEIATISYDSVVTTWSADSLEQLNQFDVDTNSLNRIEYVAPNMLAAAAETTTLWNTSTGKLVQELSPGRYSFTLARSPDGSRFVFGGEDSWHFWSVADSKQEAEITHGVSGDELLAFSPDGEFLASTNGRSVELWNLAERRVVQVIDGFGWTTVGVAWLPETNLLVVASDSGCTRIWGTPSQGAAAGLKPLHTAVALPAAGSKAPATQAQLEQLIDLRTFPQLPGSEPTMVSQHNFSCETTLSADEARLFYKYFLEKEGWAEAATPSANPMAMEFRKHGFMLSLHCYDAGDGKTSVMLDHGGNYDLRWAPKYDAAPTETVYEAENSVSYRVKADILSIETALLRKLHGDGWAAYSRLHSSYGETPDQRDMEFLRNGTTLRLSIGKFPDDRDSYTVQYSLFFNDTAAPIPPDVGFAEFDGSTEPTLVAITGMTLDEARKFYDDELAAQGWLVREHGRSLKEDHVWLSYLRGLTNMTVGLTKLPDSRTLVQIGDTGGSMWELSQAEEDPESGAGAVGLEAADFPILNPTKTAKYDAFAESIELQMDAATLAAAAEQYTEALAALGWTPEEGGIRSEEYTLVTFTKDEKDISLRARPQDGGAAVSFGGDGLLWNKELPGGKQIVSYETWLRENKQPAGLELLDKYEAEMRAIIAGQSTTSAEAP